MASLAFNARENTSGKKPFNAARCKRTGVSSSVLMMVCSVSPKVRSTARSLSSLRKAMDRVLLKLDFSSASDGSTMRCASVTVSVVAAMAG
ncbi:hypothetical protein D3C84_941610 [compost metagenome]